MKAGARAQRTAKLLYEDEVMVGSLGFCHYFMAKQFFSRRSENFQCF